MPRKQSNQILQIKNTNAHIAETIDQIEFDNFIEHNIPVRPSNFETASTSTNPVRSTNKSSRSASITTEQPSMVTDTTQQNARAALIDLQVPILKSTRNQLELDKLKK